MTTQKRAFLTKGNCLHQKSNRYFADGIYHNRKKDGVQEDTKRTLEENDLLSKYANSYSQPLEHLRDSLVTTLRPLALTRWELLHADTSTFLQ
jgi:hypothetical protein